MRSTETVWGDFLKRYYWDSILFLAKNHPDIRSLSVDFRDIERFDIELANELMEHPDSVLAHMTTALQTIDLPVDVELEDTHVRISNFPEITPIRALRSAHINKMISLRGLVKKVAEVRPEITVGEFRCLRCGHVMTVRQKSGRFVEPFECDSDDCARRGQFELLPDRSVFDDMQKLRIQDSPDELPGGQQPSSLDITVVDDLAGRVYPGDSVVINGILRSYQKIANQGKSTSFDYVLEANSIETEEKGYDEVEITSDDEAMILGLGNDPEIDNKIINSIAPSIHGHQEVKETIALQQFSGLPKTLPDGTRLRGDIHALIIGDPGTAKSQLLRSSRRIAPRGVYASGHGSTAAGLTATAVKDDFGNGNWTLEAGALVLADMGLACVDELDKMDPEDRSSMHEAMEQQTISIAKAGIVVSLKSRCSVLGAANPKFGRFDRYEPIAKQTNMPPTLLSRFDLIFVLKDEPNATMDAAISDHILHSHIAGELALRRANVRDSGITDGQVSEAMESIKPLIEAEVLRKYIAYARKNVFPIIQPEAREKLKAFYMELRKLGETPDSPLPVTARQLEALVRLGEASARMRLSSEVTIADADRVIRIVMASLNQVMKDPVTGKFDAGIIEAGISQSQRERISAIRNIILELQNNNARKDLASVEDIISVASVRNISKEQVSECLKLLIEQGDVREVKHGILQSYAIGGTNE